MHTPTSNTHCHRQTLSAHQHFIQIAACLFALCCLSCNAVADTSESNSPANNIAIAPSAAPTTAAHTEHVFIISFDQGAPAGIEKAKMPLFKTMRTEGASAREAYTIVPSITLPSHTSMLTGVGIQKHQIHWNDKWSPQQPQLQVPTIFNLAKASRPGITTAAVVSKQKFKLFQVRGDIDQFELLDGGSSIAVAQAFAKKIAPAKPNLCFIHFGEPDATGHKYGVWSPEKTKAYADSDTALQIILDAIDAAGIRGQSTLILTADHGCHDVADKNGKVKGAHGSALPDDVLIPWVAWGKSVKKHHIVPAPVVQYDTAATALWLLGVPVPESFWGRPAVSAFE
jgi:predicted AlkP superfamily pyrophosphatase or phosphodiesterase